MSRVAFRARGLERAFEGGRVRALHRVDLDVEVGESVAIVGPSGSGKTTLLNLLGLLDRPTAGELWVGGEKIDGGTDLDRLRAREIGFVFQLHNLIPTLTAAENVQVPMMALKVPRVERRARAREVLASVGLLERASFRAPKLSGGERQRVAVARALANRPRILLGDEPTGSLDSGASRELIDLLLRAREKEGVTLVVVTHDEQVASRMQRRIVLADGCIVDGEAPSAG